MLYVWTLTIFMCLPLPYGECTKLELDGYTSGQECRAAMVNHANRLPDEARLYGGCSSTKMIDI